MADGPSTPAPGELVHGEPPDRYDMATADRALVRRAHSTADTLASLITRGMLEHVARPDRLPELLFPTIDPAHVRPVWDAGVAVGYYAGQLTGRRWDPDTLDRLRTALEDAGYTGMAATLQHPEDRAGTAPFGGTPGADAPPHPADTHQHRERP
ncbi:hypothetical protein [Streptomyces sp.]|uniref:hypothetical protein n=1 Tax=Streptomyces sp. TaxID=1931 RepID=UPI002F401C9A